MNPLHIIMPVKDSLETAHDAIAALMANEGTDLTVYNDFSTAENTAQLSSMATQMGFHLHNWADHTNHPSPNYRLTLQHAQQRALRDNAHLIIVESDVTVRPDTISRMAQQYHPGIGMIAAVTVDNQGKINFPYLYAQHMHGNVVATRKRLSFCCTLLSNHFLQTYDFQQLDPTKQWYDVTLSHLSTALGFTNLLMLDNPVLHRPHSSRPWKLLKHTHPLRYYWTKLTQHRDRI